MTDTAPETTRVLWIEDNPGDVKLARKLLDRAAPCAYSVHHYVRLSEAISAAREIEPHVALLDLTLPDAHGLEGVDRLTGELPSLPVVVLTGQQEDDLGTQAVRHGAQDFLSKRDLDGRVLSRALRYACERARSQRHTAELQQRLAHADRLAAVGQIAAAVAHEINNPAAYLLANLTSLREYIVAVDRTCADLDVHDKACTLGTSIEDALHESDQMVRESLEGIDRIRHITRDLGGFARIEREHITWMSLNEVVQSACRLINKQARHRASLQMKLGDVPMLAGDRSKLVQVITNLLVNATQALEKGDPQRDRIEIRTENHDGRVLVSVQDTGPGILDVDKGRIFEPFFTTKGEEGGTGLGLSLCMDIVRHHGGTIDVHSQPGQGTCFVLMLPIETGLSPEQPASHVRDSEAEGQGPRPARVLLVDDEPKLLRGVRRLLAANHEVVAAQGGGEALRILAKDEAFDVVLCDLMMPDVDGAAFYEWVREHTPALASRIAFLSGGACTERIQQFVARLSTPVLEKPLDREAIEEAIERARKGTLVTNRPRARADLQ